MAQVQALATLSVPKTREEAGFRVKVDSHAGEAWQYWARNGQRGLPVDRD